MSIQVKLKDFDKADIRTMITRYINHRRYCYNNFKAFKTQKHFNTINKITNLLAHYTRADNRAHYYMVISIEEDLLFLLPGFKSKYHEGWKIKIEGLIKYCKDKLNGEPTGLNGQS